ncbi:Cro/C1-type HTH DNA-binding domain-containing protein [Paenibacillus uliginis N3/975]|uniref:Cro/C1-type HTH DNA-binding domain-containing protein n=1 Tax=Paenibacillus uliginis N3/975 TaxID=1313296 RepID=A0A1X7HM00_9BACL|nr:helix-turn-helix transcriptional regulator [Paenibacillus uliginis]SMF88094.1 Cro/C1-type HTH DNA-binding domain-containing protein [Paenibacillus uliginis N3/975]
MDFSKAVKVVMEKTGMRKAEIARATGYSYQHIHDLLAGERRWNEDSINKVCDALGITISISCTATDEKDGEYERANII